MKLLSRGFSTLALLLSHAMCVNTAYSYARMEYYIQQTPQFSAPATVTYWLVIPPYAAGILLCLGAACIFRKVGA